MKNTITLNDREENKDISVSELNGELYFYLWDMSDPIDWKSDSVLISEEDAKRLLDFLKERINT